MDRNLKNKLSYDPALFVAKPYIGDAETSYVLGTDSETLQIVLLKSQKENELEGLVWFGPKTAGPPGHVHGGCQAAVLDEMMGSTAWHFGHGVVAAKIEIQFLEMIPLEREYGLRGRIVKVSDRKIETQAEIYKGDTVFARSTGLFIILKEDHLKKLALHSR